LNSLVTAPLSEFRFSVFLHNLEYGFERAAFDTPRARRYPVEKCIRALKR